MVNRNERYRVTINTPCVGKALCGSLIIREVDGNTVGVGFKYDRSYLSLKRAISIDPIALPLREEAYQYKVGNNNLPGFLDDYLPDTWGRKVITRAATVSELKDFNANSLIDILSLVSKSNIGALSIDAEDEEPEFDLGVEYRELLNAENAAQIVEDPETNIQLETTKLLHLWQAGSGGVGGARPKSLINKGGTGYLAKFNRKKDDYNNARVELACLLMAQAAGIDIKGGFVEPDINGRDVLLLERFDLTKEDSRLHVISINSMLKDPNSFVDFGRMFRYDNVLEVLKRYSIKIEHDTQQLLKIMLFNRVINNTDDHERNLSLINDGSGYRLAPAYDLVPTLVKGAYHAAGYGYSSTPIGPSEINGSSRILGVPKKVALRCAEEVIEAMKNWTEYAEQAGVDEEEARLVQSFFNLC